MAQVLLDLICCLEVRPDSHQLGLEVLAKDASSRVAVCTCHGPTPQCSVDMNGPAGDNLCARSDGADHRDVALHKAHALPGPDKIVDQQRRGLHGLRCCSSLPRRTLRPTAPL